MSLEEKLKEIPMSAGVYLYKDSAGKIIYIGKAKRLRSRVHSYFQARPFDRKTDALVQANCRRRVHRHRQRSRSADP